MAESALLPRNSLSRDELVEISDRVLAEPDIAVREYEDLFQIRVAGLDWDIGAMVYEPKDPARGHVSADGARSSRMLECWRKSAASRSST